MKARIDGGRRTAYIYVCSGPCGMKRATFDYKRAQAKVCRACEPELPNPDQGDLFAPYQNVPGTFPSTAEASRKPYNGYPQGKKKGKKKGVS